MQRRVLPINRLVKHHTEDQGLMTRHAGCVNVLACRERQDPPPSILIPGAWIERGKSDHPRRLHWAHPRQIAVDLIRETDHPLVHSASQLCWTEFVGLIGRKFSGLVCVLSFSFRVKPRCPGYHNIESLEAMARWENACCGSDGWHMSLSSCPFVTCSQKSRLNPCITVGSVFSLPLPCEEIYTTGPLPSRTRMAVIS
jgi:hypothetical protein